MATTDQIENTEELLKCGMKRLIISDASCGTRGLGNCNSP
jgi:hypothetical protein